MSKSKTTTWWAVFTDNEIVAPEGTHVGKFPLLCRTKAKAKAMGTDVRKVKIVEVKNAKTN